MKSNTTTITMTQPPAWKAAWKDHMKATGRKNFSEFVGEAVNTLIANERESRKIKAVALPERGKKGSRKMVAKNPKAKKKAVKV